MNKLQLADNKYTKYISPVLWVVILQCIASLLGQLSGGGSTEWYRTIVRSSLTPPNIVFPIIWTILYIMIALAGWKLFQGFFTDSRGTDKPRLFYSIQLLLNFLWTPVFFYWHLTGVALVIIALMIIFVAFTIISTSYQFVKYMLLPYLIWISFASYLNAFIYFNN